MVPGLSQENNRRPNLFGFIADVKKTFRSRKVFFATTAYAAILLIGTRL